MKPRMAMIKLIIPNPLLVALTFESSEASGGGVCGVRTDSGVLVAERVEFVSGDDSVIRIDVGVGVSSGGALESAVSLDFMVIIPIYTPSM
jgi:hypothetical protein